MSKSSSCSLFTVFLLILGFISRIRSVGDLFYYEPPDYEPQFINKSNSTESVTQISFSNCEGMCSGQARLWTVNSDGNMAYFDASGNWTAIANPSLSASERVLQISSCRFEPSNIWARTTSNRVFRYDGTWSMLPSYDSLSLSCMSWNRVWSVETDTTGVLTWFDGSWNSQLGLLSGLAKVSGLYMSGGNEASTYVLDISNNVKLFIHTPHSVSPPITKCANFWAVDETHFYCLNNNTFYLYNASGSFLWSHDVGPRMWNDLAPVNTTKFYAVRDEFICYGISERLSAEVCSGHGRCIETDSCACDEYYVGKECENRFDYAKNIYNQRSTVNHSVTGEYSSHTSIGARHSFALMRNEKYYPYSLFLYGGGYEDYYRYGDFFEFDTNTNQFRHLHGTTDQVRNVYNSEFGKDKFHEDNWPGRRSYSWFFSSLTEPLIYVFGGISEFYSCCGYAVNDLYVYNITSGQWCCLKDVNAGDFGTIGVYSDTTSPMKMYTSSGGREVFAENNTMLFFGGFSFSFQCGQDVWEYNLDLNQWRDLKGPQAYGGVEHIESGLVKNFHTNNIPHSRTNHYEWHYDQKLYAFAGDICGLLVTNDLWVFDPQIRQWAVLTRGPSHYSAKGEVYSFNELNNPCKSSYGVSWYNGPYLYAHEAEVWVYSIHLNQWRLEYGTQSGACVKDVFCTNFDEEILGARVKAGGHFVHNRTFIFGGFSSFFQDQCYPGYHTLSDLWVYESNICNGTFFKNQTESANDICSGGGRSSCVGGDVCKCNDDEWFGSECQYPVCFGIFSNETNVCSGNGGCVGIDDCVCNDNVYYGEMCELLHGELFFYEPPLWRPQHVSKPFPYAEIVSMSFSDCAGTCEESSKLWIVDSNGDIYFSHEQGSWVSVPNPTFSSGEKFIFVSACREEHDTIWAKTDRSTAWRYNLTSDDWEEFVGSSTGGFSCVSYSRVFYIGSATELHTYEDTGFILRAIPGFLVLSGIDYPSPDTGRMFIINVYNEVKHFTLPDVGTNSIVLADGLWTINNTHFFYSYEDILRISTTAGTDLWQQPLALSSRNLFANVNATHYYAFRVPFLCNNIMEHNSSVCNQRGYCNGTNQCECWDGWCGDDCEFPICFGKFSDSACRGHGSCTTPNFCVCESPDYFGDECELWQCNGTLNNETNVCNGYGNCIDLDVCDCDPNVYGEYCDDTSSLYANCSWPTDGLIGIFSFDYTFDDITDTFPSTEVRNGTGGVVPVYRDYHLESSFHPFKTSVFFSGQGDHLVINSVSEMFPSLNEAPITISVWIKANTSDHSDVISKDDEGHSRDWQINWNGDGVRALIRDGNAFWFKDATNAVGFTPNKWLHVVMMRDSGLTDPNTLGHKIFVDGEEQNVGGGLIPVVNTPPYETAPIRMGGGSPKGHTDWWYTGEISCVHIFNRTLMDDEVTALYQDGCTCFESYYYCDGIHHKSNDTCNKRGKCIHENVCTCDSPYFGKFCEKQKCFGIRSDNVSFVCSGHGICVDHDECACSSDACGKMCEKSYCIDRCEDEDDTCSNHGSCSNETANQCECEFGWQGLLCNSMTKNLVVDRCQPILIRNRDSNFNRSYHDYLLGFGDCDGGEDCFIGLENLHQISEQNNPRFLRIEMKGSGKQKYVSLLRGFYLTEEEDGYRVYFERNFQHNYRNESTQSDEVGIDLGCCLQDGHFDVFWGQPFSTYDHGGAASSNCAKPFGGGWWFNDSTCQSDQARFTGDSLFWEPQINGDEGDIFLQMDVCDYYGIFDGYEVGVAGVFPLLYNSNDGAACDGYLLYDRQHASFVDININPPLYDRGIPLEWTVFWIDYDSTSYVVYRDICFTKGSCVGFTNNLELNSSDWYIVSGYDVNEAHCNQVTSGQKQCGHKTQIWLSSGGSLTNISDSESGCSPGAAIDNEGKYQLEVFCTQKCLPEGYTSNNPDACSGHGHCFTSRECTCKDGYFGETCHVSSCFGLLSNNTDEELLCTGHGNCEVRDQCKCEENYYGEKCSKWSCFGVSHQNTSACTGHGSCVAYDTCECHSSTNLFQYFGPKCDQVPEYNHGNIELVYSDNAFAKPVYDYTGNFTSDTRIGKRRDFMFLRNDLFYPDDSLFAFGGLNENDKPLSDLFEFSISLSQWKHRRGSNNDSMFCMEDCEEYHTSNTIGIRAGFYSFSSLDEPLLYVFGGKNATGNVLSDMWVYNITHNMWRREFRGLEGRDDYNFGTTDVFAETNHPPQYTTECSSKNLYNSTRMLYFGGMQSGGAKFGDVWEYDLSLRQFRHLHGPGTINPIKVNIGDQKNVFDPLNRPRSRTHHAEYFFGGKLYIFGGYAPGGYLNTIWAFRIESREWAFLAGQDVEGAGGSYPEPRRNFFNPLNSPYGAFSFASWGSGSKYLYSFRKLVWVFSTELHQFKVEAGSGEDFCTDYDPKHLVMGIRIGSQAVSVGNKTYITGGKSTSCNSDTLDDMWIYQGFNCDHQFFKDEPKFYPNSTLCTRVGRCVGPDSCICDQNPTKTYPNNEKGTCDPTCDGVRKSNSTFVCSGHGDCTDVDVCDCDTGTYTGSNENCGISICYGINQNDYQNVCSGHGNCSYIDRTCQCDTNYYDLECNVTTCFTAFSNDTSHVCSGHGNCDQFQMCECHDDYYGLYCNITTCFGAWNNETSYCSSHGDCEVFDTCECASGYFGSFCNTTTCFGVFSNVTDGGSCSNHGSCNVEDKCDCHSDYYGEYCNITTCFGVWNNDSNYCEGHGDCVTVDHCDCWEDQYFGLSCNITKCNHVFSNETGVVCTNHGNCELFERCDCDLNYFGEVCNITKCNDVYSNDTSLICSRRGKCNFYEECECQPNYYGEDCNVTICHEIYSNDSSLVCSGHGICNLDQICECYENYYSPFCNVTTCDNVFSNNTELLCSSHGSCDVFEKCTCQSNYFGELCDITYCSDWKLNNDTQNVCYGNGTCVAFLGTCDCYNRTRYTGLWCNESVCFGKTNNDSDVCQNHGVCGAFDTCVCYEGYDDHDCGRWYCANISIYEPPENLCGNSGECIAPDQCNCSEGYNNTFCQDYYCFGIDHRYKEKVCSGERRGSCVGHDQCQCQVNFTYAHDCSVWKCYGVSSDDGRNECSGHGKCVDPDDCECLDLYTGDNCEFWKCFGLPATDINNVCAGHGSCVTLDLCGCQSGYSSSSGRFGDPCDMWECGDYKRNNAQACNARGNCTASDECVCDERFTGDLCESWNCYGLDKDNPLVCSSKGKCVEPEICECNTNQYVGEDCATNLYLYVIMTPILSLFSVTVVLVLICCFCTCVLCTCMFCICFVIVSFGLLLKQQKKVEKFGKLKDFELLLAEQEIDQDTNIAHIRMNQKLFEIDYKDLSIIKILGEGGSDSVVYKASWKGQIIAFKCFKTRMICQNQNRFDEFEREVEIFSSISHPSIVRFFGCTIKTPRVGIVMEYCGKGELLEFLEGYHQDNKKHYDIKEKLRIIHAVSLGMEYLHARKVIHRDLKSENVLIDDQENPKIMDFGLSKIAERMSQVKTSRVGTSFYMAPEVVLSANYTEKCDVFSFAIMCFVVITESAYVYGMDDQSFGIEFKVANDPNFRPNLTRLVNFLKEEHALDGGKDYVWMKRIIERGWIHDVGKRPSFHDLNAMFMLRMKQSKFDEKEREKQFDQLVKEELSSDDENQENNEENNEEKEVRIRELEMELEEEKIMRTEREKEMELLKIEVKKLKKKLSEEIESSESEQTETEESDDDDD